VQLAAEDESESPILKAYNGALKSLKEFRDAHMAIVTLYIIGPARRSEKSAFKHAVLEKEHTEDNSKKEHIIDQAFTVQGARKILKGTGGTDLVKFLKGVRDQTVHTYLLQ
jgi:indoleamine 2,3-dioxygenase